MSRDRGDLGLAGWLSGLPAKLRYYRANRVSELFAGSAIEVEPPAAWAIPVIEVALYPLRLPGCGLTADELLTLCQTGRAEGVFQS